MAFCSSLHQKVDKMAIFLVRQKLSKIEKTEKTAKLGRDQLLMERKMNFRKKVETYLRFSRRRVATVDNQQGLPCAREAAFFQRPLLLKKDARR